MTTFNPRQPAILHDRRSGRVETWTGDDAVSFEEESVVQPDGTVEWRDFQFDGWGNVLGG